MFGAIADARKGPAGVNARKPAASTRRVFPWKGSMMSLSSAKNYALRAERSQDAKEAADLLAKAVLELVASIEATDAKVKKMNKSG
jgi:hypothetical protein